MWKYIKRYLPFAVLAALFMVGEVMMDLVQPGIMRRIVDDGVLGLETGGVGNLELIGTLGLRMIALVLFGGLCGSLNNVFTHISSQNIGHEMRKDAFRRIMSFSFPQLDRFGPGSLVTRVTNDITQVQNFVSLFVRGLIRTSLLTFGSMYCMFRLNREFGAVVLCAFPFVTGCIILCLWKANPLFSKLQEQLDSAPELADGGFEGGTDRQGEIEFRDVSFTYPGAARPVLEHINLTVRQGETVAIMGATGCGKTTLVNLIPRFYDVTAGAVLVDGVDVQEYRQQALREKIAVALQKAELFTVSIAENISWGRPGAPSEAITAAAETAQADGFIRSTPDGYGTVVAERGMSLSGGQRQRLSIARAVVKSAEILIFDDATSALDLKTEADLYAALQVSCPGATKLIVAQRVASVRQADRIVVLENGRVAAVGTHKDLLAECRIYQDICHSQLGEEAEGIA